MALEAMGVREGDSITGGGSLRALSDELEAKLARRNRIGRRGMSERLGGGTEKVRRGTGGGSGSGRTSVVEEVLQAVVLAWRWARTAVDRSEVISGNRDPEINGISSDSKAPNGLSESEPEASGREHQATHGSGREGLSRAGLRAVFAALELDPPSSLPSTYASSSARRLYEALADIFSLSQRLPLSTPNLDLSGAEPGSRSRSGYGDGIDLDPRPEILAILAACMPPAGLSGIVAFPSPRDIVDAAVADTEREAAASSRRKDQSLGAIAVSSSSSVGSDGAGGLGALFNLCRPSLLIQSPGSLRLSGDIVMSMLHSAWKLGHLPEEAWMLDLWVWVRGNLALGFTEESRLSSAGLKLQEGEVDIEDRRVMTPAGVVALMQALAGLGMRPPLDVLEQVWGQGFQGDGCSGGHSIGLGEEDKVIVGGGFAHLGRGHGTNISVLRWNPCGLVCLFVWMAPVVWSVFLCGWPLWAGLSFCVDGPWLKGACAAWASVSTVLKSALRDGSSVTVLCIIIAQSVLGNRCAIMHTPEIYSCTYLCWSNLDQTL